MKENNNNQKFDQAINQRFSDFQFNPDPSFFDRIQSEMETNEFDEEVKNRFDKFTVQPSEEVWESVKPNLPLHLGIRIQLQRLSRVAAVILFIMTGFYLFQFQQNQSLIAEIDNNLPTENTTSPSSNTNFDIELSEVVTEEEEEINKTDKNLHKKKKSKKKGITDYLALILNDEDDFDNLIDHEKIKKILQPVEKLSPDFMSASALAPLPRYVSFPVTNNQEIEFNINIPLQVVEPHEVDELIKLYDESQRLEM